MPGISFIYQSYQNQMLDKSRFSNCLDILLHNEEYKKEIYSESENYFLAVTKYDDYPFCIIKNSEFTCFIEGKLYNTEASKLVGNIMIKYPLLSKSKNDFYTYLSNQLMNVDGDFVILIFNKQTNEFLLLNDLLGRLPLYFYQGNENLVISREIKFIYNMIGKSRFDKMSIAQYLFFGYTLGKRTLFENIYRLQPATAIYINPVIRNIDIKVLHSYNFDEKQSISHPEDEIVNTTYDLFLEACDNRADPNRTNVVSLSGGLDSRAVTAGLITKNCQFKGVTYLDSNSTAKEDVKVAKKLSKILDIDWILLTLNPTTGKDFYELLKLKSGVDSFSVGFLYSFLNMVIRYFGRGAIYFTGDGGDKVLPDLRPNKKFYNKDELVEYIISNKGISTLNMVSEIMRMDITEFKNELKNHLSTYPEKNFQNIFIHFLIFERGFKWLFEGEDRNRYFLWSVTPFYSVPFFNYVMKIPDRFKHQHKLYRKLLFKLSPKTYELEAAFWKQPISSYKFFLLMYIKDNIYTRLPTKIKRFINNKMHSINRFDINDTKKVAASCLQEQLRNCKVISEYFSISNLKDLSKMSKSEFDHFFTIVSVIEKFECGRSTLKQYFDSIFD